MSRSPEDAAEALDEAHLSASEKLLFGGELAYDAGWTQHNYAWLKLSLKAMALSLPNQIAVAVRLAHQADRGALYTVAASEIGRGVAQAASLDTVNSLMVELLSEGAMEERLRSAMPSIITVGLLAVVGSMLSSVSAAATGILEPKTQRVATEKYLALVAWVEVEAVEDDDFHPLMDSAQYGADSARRMLVYCAAVVAAGGVLSRPRTALLPHTGPRSRTGGPAASHPQPVRILDHHPLKGTAHAPVPSAHP
ncbi:hypothetical protein [Streptomyces globisporus]|uniref:hypothetical protein n=1 Tax=Streptomyces globisporus TaxID=1908 RepID=UPI00379B18BF